MANRSPSGSPQLDLLGGLGGSSAALDRLFLALMPDDATRAAFVRAADGLRET
jgi:hypothetical protein